MLYSEMRPLSGLALSGLALWPDLAKRFGTRKVWEKQSGLQWQLESGLVWLLRPGKAWEMQTLLVQELRLWSDYVSGL